MAASSVRLVDDATITTTTTFPDPSNTTYKGDEAYVAELFIAGPVTGTTPTIDVVIQGSLDAGKTWFVVTTFTQKTAVTAAPVTAVIAANTYGHKLRTVATVGGTTPSFGAVEVVIG